MNIEAGKVVWEVPQPGPAKAKSWSGVLATAGGLVFYGQPKGGFAAVDERDEDFVAVSNQRAHESFSDDVHGGREAVCGGWGWPKHFVLRTMT